MHDIFQVDAFATVPFEGNPAAVCPLDAPADDAWMQAVAMEMNLSETAFLWPEDDVWRLRWFTPAVEVALCGHATLASAHILWETGRLPHHAAARFETRSGTLICTRDDAGIRMDFPADPPQPGALDDAILHALGVGNPVATGHGVFDAFVVLRDAAAVRAVAPDFQALAACGGRGVIVTAPTEAGTGYDFVSRMFAPAAGINEDPVTGSAHCTLAPYWAAELGRTRLTGRQLSRRGGTVGVELRGDRVHLTGQAITTLRGTLLA